MLILLLRAAHRQLGGGFLCDTCNHLQNVHEMLSKQVQNLCYFIKSWLGGSKVQPALPTDQLLVMICFILHRYFQQKTIHALKGKISLRIKGAVRTSGGEAVQMRGVGVFSFG